MLQRHIAVACLLAFCLLYWTQLPAAACGYHDSKNVRTGILNWIYPNCLHVRGAVWSAQKAGELPAADTTSYQETEQVLKSLGDEFGVMKPNERTESFSVILVEALLWTQFTLSDEQETVVVDASGPGDGDLVVVTDEPVLYAMEKGTLTLSIAVESGMVKIYGDQERISNFLKLYGSIGERSFLKHRSTVAKNSP